MFLKASSVLAIVLAGFLADSKAASSSSSTSDSPPPPYPDQELLSKCPGYEALNVKTSATGLKADLKLAGTVCNVYGDDIPRLSLEVVYETDTRLHVKIQDADGQVYQVPEHVFPRPSAAASAVSPADSKLRFEHTDKPFSFRVHRSGSDEVLFDTSAASFVFESQYLRLRTRLPAEPNLYGLGEHTDPFRLNTTDYVRTLWARDAPAVPAGQNLYSSHPVYLEHRGGRDSGSHGVFLLNSNGMDVMVNKTVKTDHKGMVEPEDEYEDDSGQYLEYNTLGGVFDFYFFAGPSPTDVTQQYAGVVGLPAHVPYWGFGLHQCRYGYQDAYEVAEVIYNYSRAGIPLETMWGDIDYMDRRRVFSLDPDRYPLYLMRQLVDHLHANDQHYIMMVDPAVAHADYPPFARGIQDNAFLTHPDGSVWKGVVWPGLTVFPDWFSPEATNYWIREFALFFSSEHGVDIDALWIDMNEPSNFHVFPRDDPEQEAIGLPPAPLPVRFPPRPLPGWPCDFQPEETNCQRTDRTKAEMTGGLDSGDTPSSPDRRVQLPHDDDNDDSRAIRHPGLPGRDLLYPKYAIHNKDAYRDDWNAARGGLSNHTVHTDVIHRNGLAMYDTHNLYGQMMSQASRVAMLARRPAVRPLIITRSNFPGAGASVGHWLGDNDSTWHNYRASIRSMLAFTSIFQVPMVGSDVCGFIGDVTEELCARWASLGAFYPFYRNHNDVASDVSQEFYHWDSVAESARRAIEIRYRLMDYIYTAFWRQTVDGTPLLSPVFFLYPSDPATFGLDLQFFYGPGLLVAPVTDEGATSVSVYFPDDVFYHFHGHNRIDGRGGYVTLEGLGTTEIPLFFRGGVVVPMRIQAAPTTAKLRWNNFEILVAVGRDRTATGELRLDDGVSLEQPDDETTHVQFAYADGRLKANGKFGYRTEVKIVRVTVLDGSGRGGEGSETVKQVEVPLTGPFEVNFDDDVKDEL